MNEFTKEELSMVYNALRIMYKNGWDEYSDLSAHELSKKVNKLITNYEGHICTVCKIRHYNGIECGLE